MAVRMSTAIPRDALRYEPSPSRVRGELGGETVVDSYDAWLVWEPGHVVPGWCFPRDDVSGERLAAAGVALRDYDDSDLAGRVGIAFTALDRWLEEEAEVVAHPRDPFVRVDARPGSRHIRVLIDGEVVADSRRPVVLVETGLPVRWYLPPGDVRTDRMEPSDRRTLCAYKGEARYWSAPGLPDVAWYYPDPLPEQAAIRGRIAFLGEHVDIEVDGRRLERPVTKWS